MRFILNAILFLLTVLYPFAIYYGVEYQNLEVRHLAILLFAVVAVKQLISKKPPTTENTSSNDKLMTILLFIFLLLVVIFNSESGLRLYPVVINLSLLYTFAYTVFYPPSFIERMGRMFVKNFPDESIPYAKKATIAWCLFFTANALFSAYTAWFFSLKAWSLYNGFISYLLIGVMFIGEYIVRKIVQRNRRNKANAH